MSNDNSLGIPLPEGWTVPPRPVRAVMEGKLIRLEPLVVAHAEDLHAANLVDRAGRNWDYLPYGPYDSLGAYQDWVGSVTRDGDPMFYAVVQQGDGRAVGVASLMRINPASGSIEVGHINFSPLLQRKPGATAAIAEKQARHIAVQRAERTASMLAVTAAVRLSARVRPSCVRVQCGPA